MRLAIREVENGAADRWQTKENAEFLRQLGLYHGLMRLNSSATVLQGGLDSYLQVLDAQRNLFRRERDLATLQRQ